MKGKKCAVLPCGVLLADDDPSGLCFEHRKPRQIKVVFTGEDLGNLSHCDDVVREVIDLAPTRVEIVFDNYPDLAAQIEKALVVEHWGGTKLIQTREGGTLTYLLQWTQESRNAARVAAGAE